jgi:hypothetical protein
MKARRHERLEARARPNVVYFCCYLVLFAYFGIGQLSLVRAIATDIPLIWKCVLLAAMFASIWYSDWRINRRVLDPKRPRLPRLWLMWVGTVSFIFAIVCADKPLLFFPSSVLILLFLKCSSRHLDRKLDQIDAAAQGDKAIHTSKDQTPVRPTP